MRALRVIRNILAVLGVIWLCMPIYRQAKSVFTLTFPWVWEEKGRVVAPSGHYELVTYRGNRGAMSSFAYVCFLVKPGGKADPNACDFYEPVLSTSHTAPKPRWESDTRLIVNCDGGYVGHHRPYCREFNVAIEVEGADNPPRVPGP